MSLQNTYNNENILSRAVIAGLLNVLNNSVRYEQAWANDDIETINVPWFYNMSSDERFAQDFYTFYAACNFPRPVDGNFDVIPRGVITYSGTIINAQRITSRYVQGRYLKEISGQLQSFTSYLNSIPLDMSFACELWLDNQVTAMKVEQAIREVFYKTVTFYVYYKGLRLGCTAGFPEQIALEKNIEYSFETMNKITIKFDLEVEAYQPVFDPTTEVNSNDYMRGIGYRLYQAKEKSDGAIQVTVPSENAIIPKGTPVMFEWTYNKEGAIINKVDALWSESGSAIKNVIERGIPNHEFWVWNVPDTFTSFKDVKIIWDEDSSVKIFKQPFIKILPDASTKIIDANSFYIIDEGYFLSSEPDASINIVLEMKDSLGRTKYTGDASICLNILNYQLDPTNPIFYITPNLTFAGDVSNRMIDVYIANSVNNTVFGSVKNLNIM